MIQEERPEVVRYSHLIFTTFSCLNVNKKAGDFFANTNCTMLGILKTFFAFQKSRLIIFYSISQ